MKEFTFNQVHPNLGIIKGFFRVIGKLLYFKFNNTQQSQAMIAQLEQKGAKIDSAGGWIRVNIFTKGDIYKLGEREFNIMEISNEECETILYDFFYNQYKKMGFKIE